VGLPTVLLRLFGIIGCLEAKSRMETDFTGVVGYCLQIAEDTATAGTRTYNGLFGEVHSGSECRSHRRSTPGRIGNEKRAFAESDPKPLAPAPSVLANLNGQIAVLFHFSAKPTNQALTTLSVDILTAAGPLCGRVRRSAR